MEVVVDKGLESLINEIRGLERRIECMWRRIEESKLEVRVERGDGSVFVKIMIPHSVLLEMLKEVDIIKKDVEKIEKKYGEVINSAKLVAEAEVTDNYDKVLHIVQKINNTLKESNLLWKIDSVNRKINEMMERVESVSNTVRDLQSRIKELDKKVERIEKRIGRREK